MNLIHSSCRGGMRALEAVVVLAAEGGQARRRGDGVPRKMSLIMLHVSAMLTGLLNRRRDDMKSSRLPPPWYSL